MAEPSSGNAGQNSSAGGIFRIPLSWAKQAGFSNISADVIFRLPGQTWEEWRETLEETVAAGVTHLSAYSLKIEEGTVFYQWQQQGKLREMEMKNRKLYHQGAALLEESGAYAI
jgi:oxygen-independent coproporphyrinogen-3 oxidase